MPALEVVMAELPAYDWLRIGLAVTGSAAVAYAAARHMGLVAGPGERHGQGGGAAARWSVSEGKALEEIRLRTPAPRGSPIPSAPVLLSDSEAASHRGYR
jgi:hypothetical protein